MDESHARSITLDFIRCMEHLCLYKPQKNIGKVMVQVTVSVQQEVSMRGMIDYEIVKTIKESEEVVLEMTNEAYKFMRFISLEKVGR